MSATKKSINDLLRFFSPPSAPFFLPPVSGATTVTGETQMNNTRTRTFIFLERVGLREFSSKARSIGIITFSGDYCRLDVITEFGAHGRASIDTESL